MGSEGGEGHHPDSAKSSIADPQEICNADAPKFTKVSGQPLQARDHIAKEILSTEVTYVSSLKTVVKTILQPVREKGLLNEQDITAIFSNLEDILSVNTLLLEQLAERLSKWSDSQQVGDVFLKLIPFLKMYTLYTTNYDSAIQAVIAHESKSSGFSAFMQEWEASPSIATKLPAFLILPVQRIPRYNLLLQELLKKTAESHADFAALQAALEGMKSVAVGINENIRQAEHRQVIINIQQQLTSRQPLNLVEPHRLFVKRGALWKICRKSKKQREFFLFNDILLYASELTLPGRAKWRVCRTLQLERTKVEEAALTDHKFAFMVVSEQKSFLLCCASQEEKDEWMTRLDATIKEWVRRCATMGRQVDWTPQAPVWVPDTESEACVVCKSAFTFISRRHHCRMCGQLVCATCSPFKRLLPGQAKPARCCVLCEQSGPGRGTPPTTRPLSDERAQADKDNATAGKSLSPRPAKAANAAEGIQDTKSVSRQEKATSPTRPVPDEQEQAVSAKESKESSKSPRCQANTSGASSAAPIPPVSSPKVEESIKDGRAAKPTGRLVAQAALQFEKVAEQQRCATCRAAIPQGDQFCSSCIESGAHGPSPGLQKSDAPTVMTQNGKTPSLGLQKSDAPSLGLQKSDAPSAGLQKSDAPKEMDAPLTGFARSDVSAASHKKTHSVGGVHVPVSGHRKNHSDVTAMLMGAGGQGRERAGGGGLSARSPRGAPSALSPRDGGAHACRRCGALLRAEARFCNLCGTTVECGPASPCARREQRPTHCHACRTALKPNANFCPECGVPVAVVVPDVPPGGVGAASPRPLACTRCSAALTRELRFCVQCGASADVARQPPPTSPLPHVPQQQGGKAPAPVAACRSCSAPLKAGLRFCGRCGATASQPANSAKAPHPLTKSLSSTTNITNPPSTDGGVRTHPVPVPVPASQSASDISKPGGLRQSASASQLSYPRNHKYIAEAKERATQHPLPKNYFTPPPKQEYPILSTKQVSGLWKNFKQKK